MAKYKSKSPGLSLHLDNSMLFVVLVAVAAGFVGGFLFAKDRYTNKITEISRMNMEKAVTIDSLNSQLKVLGASTEAE